MKKIKLNTNKLQLVKEKITDLTHEQMFKMEGGDGYSLQTCWACITYTCSSACTSETCNCSNGCPPPTGTGASFILTQC
ncbi:class I lanthipeptide [Chitinophaga polysaccharea]|uniref:class I lanthipeptide n=1 Tax=Chitinophaga polysaccharea TaxID=1293035 RepID=UPI001B3B289A